MPASGVLRSPMVAIAAGAIRWSVATNCLPDIRVAYRTSTLFEHPLTILHPLLSFLQPSLQPRPHGAPA